MKTFCPEFPPFACSILLGFYLGDFYDSDPEFQVTQEIE
jgi:hypothetical protein